MDRVVNRLRQVLWIVRQEWRSLAELGDDLAPVWSWILGGAALILVLLGWGLISGTGWVDALFLPSPARVATALQGEATSGQLWSDSVASISRVLLGFALSALVSLPLGLLMGSFGSVSRALEPLMGLIRYMPAPAFIPLLIIYFGLGELPKVLLIFLGTVFFNTLMIMDAVKFVPQELIESTYTLGGSRRQILGSVILPYIAPNVIDAFRINMASAWNLVIVAELIAANEGLGKRISLAQRFLRTDEIFACLIVIGLIGIAIDLGFRWLMKVSCRWTGT